VDPAIWFAENVRLETALGLPTGFIEHLVEEDDWSFVVKAHALLEACATELLVRSSDSRLTPIFKSMQLGGGRASKMEFVRALGLLDDPAISFVRWLGELRNRIVHDVRHVGFSLVTLTLPPI
jgi:hypothetical protein